MHQDYIFSCRQIGYCILRSVAKLASSVPKLASPILKLASPVSGDKIVQFVQTQRCTKSTPISITSSNPHHRHEFSVFGVNTCSKSTSETLEYKQQPKPSSLVFEFLVKSQAKLS